MMPAEHFQGRSRSRKQAKIKALKTSSEKKGGASSEKKSEASRENAGEASSENKGEASSEKRQLQTKRKATPPAENVLASGEINGSAPVTPPKKLRKTDPPVNNEKKEDAQDSDGLESSDDEANFRSGRMEGPQVDNNDDDANAVSQNDDETVRNLSLRVQVRIHVCITQYCDL